MRAYFTRRAQGAAVAAGALSLAALFQVQNSDPAFYSRLTGRALPLVWPQVRARPLVVSAARAWIKELDRDPDEQRGTAVGRAGHVERAADHLDAVAEPGQPGPPGGVGAADPVVADRQPHDCARRVESDVHDRGARAWRR